jgi:hypothetical protein
VRLLNREPRLFEISNANGESSSQMSTHTIEHSSIKDCSQIIVYETALEIELFNEQITSIPSAESLSGLILPKTKEEARLLIERDECKTIERKPSLFDHEFDVMRTIDSFLNTEGGELIIGQGDDKSILGLEGDYVRLPGNRENFDKFRNYLMKLIKDKYFLNSIVLEFLEAGRHEIDNKDICILHIQKSYIPIFVYHEGNQLFYVRRMDNSTRLEKYDLSAYIMQHFCKSYGVAESELWS